MAILREIALTGVFLAITAAGGCVLARGGGGPGVPEAERLNPCENPMPRHWQVAGPYPEAEAGRSPGAEMPAPAAGPAWRRGERTGDLVDLARLLGGSGNRIGYARTTLRFDRDTVSYLMFAATGSRRAWINGRQVHAGANKGGTFDKRDGVFAARFRKGDNEILLEVDSGPRGWAFSLTLADPWQPWLHRRSDYSRGRLTLNVSAGETGVPRLVGMVPPKGADAGTPGEAGIVVRDESGRELARETFDIRRGFPLPPAPVGVRAVEVLQQFADGTERIGTICLAEGDLSPEVRAAADRAGRWLDGPGRNDRRQRGRLLWLAEVALGRDWRASPKVADAYEFANLRRLIAELETGRNALSARRGAFLWAFVAGADGSGQPIGISLPDDYRPGRAYPLVVYLHGSGGSWLSEAVRSSPSAEPYIQISGDWRRTSSRSYHGLAELDIREAVAFMREQFVIDPARVYQLGHSYGGFAAWRLGSLYPGMFAALASHAGLPEGYPLSNLAATPLRSFHGMKDLGVCPVFAYYGAAEVTRAGGASDVVAYPEGGHWTYGANGDAVRWLLTQRARALPRRLDFTTRWVSRGRGKAHWIEVLELDDPHRAARVQMAAEGPRLTGTVQNVALLELQNLRELLGTAGRPELLLNGRAGSLPVPVPERMTLRFARDGAWADVTGREPRPAEPLYSEGSLQNLFDGRPIKVVVPSGGSAAYREAVGRAAAQLSGTRQPYGGIPAVADAAVDPAAPGAHLIVLGSPETNACMKALLAMLPLSESGGKVAVPVLGEYALEGRGYAFYHHHPRQPQYRVLMFRSDSPEYFRDMLSVLPDGRYRPDLGPTLDAAPDFALFDVAARRLLRVAYFDKDWEFPAEYADSPKLDPALAERRELYGRLGEAMRQVSKADYAFTLYDDEPRIDPETMRTADLACLARAVWGVGLVDGLVVEFDDSVMKYVVDRSHDPKLVGKAYDPYALWPWPEKPWTKSGGKYTVCLLANRFQDFGTVTRAKWARAEDMAGSVRPVAGDFLGAFLSLAGIRRDVEGK